MTRKYRKHIDKIAVSENQPTKSESQVFTQTVTSTEETRKKMSLAQKGKKRPKLSEKLKGRKLSEETKRKLSLAHKGKKLSKEHIEAIRLARWGNGKKS